MEEWVPFARREEWADVAPVRQEDADDAEPPVCAISYTERFRETMSYLRAVLATDERSARALRLTAEAIEQNNSNYTAWWFRRRCLAALCNSDPAAWRAELALVSSVAAENPKNYQLWYHRQATIERLSALPDALDADALAGELAWVEEMLEDDSKNYHAWSYRQWVVARFGLWDGELAFTERLITEDARNNSAWNHRFFVLTRGNGAAVVAADDVEREMAYAARVIAKAPNNESPWLHIRGIARSSGPGTRLADVPQLKELGLEYERKCPACPHCLTLLADIAQEEGEGERRAALLTVLRDRVDTIRRHYWDYLLSH